MEQTRMGVRASKVKDENEDVHVAWPSGGHVAWQWIALFECIKALTVE